VCSRATPLAAIAAAVIAAGCGGAGASNGSGAWQERQPGWTALPPPPIARSDVVAWTGDALFVWGGDTSVDGASAEGAFFDAASLSWRELPRSVLEPREQPATAWTGTEILVWGGDGHRGALGDGAAYDPAADRWRMLPPAPLEPGRPSASVWTGDELVVWGNAGRFQSSRGGAAYDPAEDRWRPVAEAPIALNQATAVWTGENVVVFGSLLDGNNGSRSGGAHGLAYDPDQDAWRRLPHHPLSPQASSIAWTGDRVLAWDYLLDAALYDPGEDTWRVLPQLPLDDSECYPDSVLIDRYVLAWYCGRGALFDLESETWLPVEWPPHPVNGTPVAADGSVLFASQPMDDYGSRLWAYVPPR
jgi:hypothetical protein